MANQNRTGIEAKPTHTKTDTTVVVVLDDGSTQDFASEADARAVHPRARVVLKSEVEADE